MPLTVRHLARVAVLVIGCAAAVLLGLVAVSRSDAGSIDVSSHATARLR